MYKGEGLHRVVVLDEEETMREDMSASRSQRRWGKDEELVQTDGVAGLAQHSRQCTGDGDVDATAKRTH